MTLTLSNRQARQLILNKQGLAHPRRQQLTIEGLYELIHQMGFVQLDTINTVERAHHMILFSRNSTYKQGQLKSLFEKDRRLFEHWTHDASMIPIEFYPYWQSRFKKAQKAHLTNAGWKKRLGPRPNKILNEVLGRIEEHGPHRSRDFKNKPKNQSAWWGWSPSKSALEYHWRTGTLAVSSRDKFQKVYDLAHRVIPEDCQCRDLSHDEIIDWKCRSALERLGIGTTGEIARFWNTVSTKQVAKWAEGPAQSELQEVLVKGSAGTAHTALAFQSLEKDLQSMQPAPKALRFLSPFDPVIRDRARLESLFGFDYRIEIFVPEKDRKYGYYVLPILEGDRLTGRADLKTHRKEDRMELKGLWWEPKIKQTPAREAALRKELERLAKFTGVSKVDADSALAKSKKR
jgi:uncharacterized protein YcaQ